jgi:lysophospholipase L1-like esterase
VKPTTILPLALLALVTSAKAQVNPPFYLQNGDRVVFYGDSITDARLYTVFTEAYVLTRFPGAKVDFVHSGWGGDRVTGGGGGPVDLRLERDIFRYRPTVVTVMLGMNDGGYRAFDQGLADTFEKGYLHIVDRLKERLPGVRLTLIQPSPFDDVTREPGFPGGYNATLLRYSETIGNIARSKGATLADLNGPIVAMLTAANAKDPAMAQRLLPDRVHPGGAGHLGMAQALLKAWNAPAVVSATEVDAPSAKATILNGRISGIAKLPDGGISWRSNEAALPFPLDLSDPLTALSVSTSGFVEALNQQTLKVQGLDPTRRYALSIDGTPPTITLTGAEWAAGTNLATLTTPMQLQAREVMALIRARTDVHQTRWRSLQVPLERRTEATKEREKALKAIDAYEEKLAEAARKVAKPREHRFTLAPVA